MTIRLSICIPTYNRARFIGEALNSVFSQASGEVEVVVCDNASTDDTQQIVAERFRGHPHVRYFRWERNMGADRNFLKVVEEASGEYCWLLGSDDIIEPGAIAHVLSALSEEPGLSGLSVGRNAYDFTMSKRIWMPQARVVKMRTDTTYTGASEAFEALGLYFGYLSGQIVRRDRWLRFARAPEIENYFNAYVHIYVIARMLQADPRWRYLTRPCVGWRSGNDSFLSNGLYNRIVIDVAGYSRIASDVFGKHSAPYRTVMAGVADVILPAGIISAKLNGADRSFFSRLLTLCFPVFWRYPVFWWRVAPLFLIPGKVFSATRSIYRMTLKRHRLSKA